MLPHQWYLLSHSSLLLIHIFNVQIVFFLFTSLSLVHFLSSCPCVSFPHLYHLSHRPFIFTQHSSLSIALHFSPIRTGIYIVSCAHISCISPATHSFIPIWILSYYSSLVFIWRLYLTIPSCELFLPTLHNLSWRAEIHHPQSVNLCVCVCVCECFWVCVRGCECCARLCVRVTCVFTPVCECYFLALQGYLGQPGARTPIQIFFGL